MDDTVEDGLLDGRGGPWWNAFQHHTLQYGRPRLIELMFSQNLVVRNLRIRDAAFWNVHFYASQDILVEWVNITSPIDAPNTDGLDLDSVLNVTVRHCEIAVGDDAIAVKSGLNQAGVDFARPSAHIHLHNLWLRSKCLAIGSEMSGGVYDVLAEHVLLGDHNPRNGWHGLYIKSRRERGGAVRDIVFRNISTLPGGTAETSTPFINVDMYYGPGEPEGKPARSPPVFRNLSFESIKVHGTHQVARIRGLADSPASIVRFDGLLATHYSKGIECANVTGVTVAHTSVPTSHCDAAAAGEAVVNMARTMTV